MNPEDVFSIRRYFQLFFFPIRCFFCPYQRFFSLTFFPNRRFFYSTLCPIRRLLFWRFVLSAFLLRQLVLISTTTRGDIKNLQDLTLLFSRYCTRGQPLPPLEAWSADWHWQLWREGGMGRADSVGRGEGSNGRSRTQLFELLFFVRIN
jgi:hypothetical protein